MIRAFDLFHRSVITPNEKKILKYARKTAKTIFSKRFESPYKENWTEKAEEVTEEAVEQYVIRAIKLGDKYNES